MGRVYLDEATCDVELCNMGRVSLDKSTCDVGLCSMGRISLDEATCDVGLCNMGRVSLDQSTCMQDNAYPESEVYSTLSPTYMYLHKTRTISPGITISEMLKISPMGRTGKLSKTMEGKLTFWSKFVSILIALRVAPVSESQLGKCTNEIM